MIYLEHEDTETQRFIHLQFNHLQFTNGTLYLVNGLMNCHVERSRDISRSV